jgi:D-alanyl-D-alanine carboxypeptidase
MLNRDNKLLIFILILVALEAFLFFSGNLKLNKKQKIEQERLAKIQKVFSESSVLAKSFSIYDVTDKKEIYNKNVNKIFPLASLSKIMTAVISLEKNNLDSIFVITKKSSQENKNNSLTLNEKWKLSDLVKFTLVSSSNTGALNLVKNDKNFVNEMNQKAKVIGMKNSIFSNVTGLDIGNVSYGTASDINLLAIYAVEKYPQVFKITSLPNLVFKNKTGNIRNVKNTNLIADKIPNLIFSKTGYTTLAGGNLTIIFKNKSGHNIAITLLGSTEVGRFSDMEKLVEIAYNLDYGTSN